MEQPDIIPSQKIYYLDHIKLLLTILVVLHHAFVVYGGPGGWYYREPATDLKALIPMTVFVSTNQAFFMGLYFLLSAYFIEPSLKRKGTWVYLKDRFKRLGIPLLVYSFILSPVMNFWVYRYALHKTATFWQYINGYDDWIDPGVLWFIVALLLFTLIFVALYNLKLTGSRSITKLNGWSISGIAIALGLITFLLRTVWPVGKILDPVGFNLGHFPQYLLAFTIGILARRGNLAENLDLKLAKRFAWLAAALIIIVFPLMFYIQGVNNAPISYFDGGLNIEALIYSFYEQALGIFIMVALTGIARNKWNNPSKPLSLLSRDSFAVYIFHPVVLVAIILLLRNLITTPTIKLLIAAPTAVIGSFLLGALIMRIPGVNKII